MKRKGLVSEETIEKQKERAFEDKEDLPFGEYLEFGRKLDFPQKQQVESLYTVPTHCSTPLPIP
jgi:hypothetical protein